MPDKVNMQELLSLQRKSFSGAGYPEVDSRIDRLDRLLTMLKKYDSQICETISEDFGGRAFELSRLADVFLTVEQVKHAITNVSEWMKTEQRPPPLPAGDAGATTEIRSMPKGIVGIIGPWNFPVHLILGPLVCVLAAGNRAMLKPSEITPKTALLIDEMIGEFFDPTEVAVVLGGAKVSEEFSQLPFDHLMFTGSTTVGRHVMRAAAENLTPVTLELGGKSPVVIDKDVDLSIVAARIMAGKLFNTGQVCVSPDYAFVPEELLRPLIAELEKATSTLFPSIADNPEYTAIVNENHFRRLQHLISDATAAGIETITFNPADEDYEEAANRKLLPRVLLDPPDDSAVMREEIFGPLLPIKSYKQIDEVAKYINAHDRPLALYYFGNNEQHRTQFLNDIVAGGMAVNDVVTHVTCHQLPFGGTGASGMGRYHGIDGFREFSHLKAVYTQTPVEEIAGFMRPPYSDAMRGLLQQQISEG
ncbi:MAG: coniferyl aldehyde dehydrogenase [Pseudomonadales bacterium]|nr:coniferyl aldehyde dehydrogenase [Pseudomonadales bacterium]